MELPVSDRLFRHAFSTPQSACELALNFLPPAYRRRVCGSIDVTVGYAMRSFTAIIERDRETGLFVG